MDIDIGIDIDIDIGKDGMVGEIEKGGGAQL